MGSEDSIGVTPDATRLASEVDRVALSADEDTPEHVDGDLVNELSHITAQLSRPAEPTEARIPRPTPTGAHESSWAELARILAFEVTSSTSSRRAAVFLHELGRVHELQLGQPERAREYYRESFGRDQSFSLNTRDLSRVLLRAGEVAEAVRVLSAEAAVTASPDERVAIRTEAAGWRARRLGELTRAREELQRALEIDPDDGVVAHVLLELLEKVNDFPQVESLLRRQIARTEDRRLRALLSCRIAQLREHYFNDAEGAAKLYRAALNEDPTQRYAQRALLRTARARRDYPTAAKLCESLAAAEVGATAAGLHWDAAQIYGEQLRNDEQAIQALERAATCAPQDRAILCDLASSYERRKNWGELVSTLERLADLTGDAEQAGNLRYRAARVRIERLHEHEGAMQALELAFNMAPRHQGVRSTLGRLYARHERHEALLRLLEAEAELFEDPERRAATAFRSGDIYEKKLQQLETAAQAYERALEFRPAYRPAVSAVARVYALLERHEDLIALFEQQVAGSPDPEEKLVLLDHIAGIWDRTLRDPAAALSAYERVIAIAPTSLPAMHALRRLYAMGTRWHDLAGILRAEAEHTLDRWRRAAILSELAEVHERALGQRELALGACLEALQTVPQYQPALMMAGRLLADAGNFERLVELHRQELEVTEDAAHRVWILLKIGRLLLERLQRPEEALDVFVQAMQGADDPASVAADMVLRLARVRGDAALERKVLGAMPVPPSPRDRSMYHRQLGLLCWAEGLHQEAIKQLRLALVGPEDPALHELRSLLALQQDRRGLVELYEGALQQTDGVSAKLFILHRLGRLYGTMPHELHRAARAWEQVLDLSPRNPVALRQLETICGLLGRWDELVAVVELQRENSEDEDFRLGCALEVVALREDRLDDLPGAAQAAVEVLEKHPAHSEALATLERHARWSANADELLQVLGRQLKMAQTAAEQAALLLASAAVHANRDEMARACESYRLAIDVMPSYLPALRGWYRAAERLGDATQMARALELEARACKTPERQAACLYESARLWELRNDDVERAAKNYWRVLQIQPRHAETTRALSALLAMKMDFRQLVELIEHQLDHAEEPAEQRDLLARIADVQRSRLGDLGAARRTVSRALELFPGDRQLLSTLAELCRASEDYEALAQVNQRLVAVTSDPVLLKGLHFELGRLWEERLGEPERSVEAYRAVLRLDPNDLGALTHLCAVLRTLRDWAGAAEVTEKLAQRDNDRGRIKGYYLILAQIQADGFGRLDRAVEACRKALALDPGDAAATAVMADLLQRREDLRGLNAHLESTLAVHRARIDRDPFAVESYRALLRVFEWQNAVQRCEVVHCVLQAIGAAAPESRSVIARMSDERWARPARGITAEELVGVLVHPEERGSLRQVLLLVEPILRKLRLPKRVPRKAIKLSARAEDPVAVLARELAQTVGARDFHGYRYTSAPRGVFASDTVTPSLVFGGDCESIPPDDLRFLTARALANIALHHTPLTRLGAAELGKMLATILWIVCATFTPPHPRELLGEIRGTIEKLMSARLRARLEAPAIALTSRPFAPESWFEWFVQSEDRIALAATGDVIAALNVIVREETGKELGGMAPGELAERSGARTRHILSFAVSEEYLTLRERLSLALR